MVNSRRLTVDAENIEVVCTSEDLSLLPSYSPTEGSIYDNEETVAGVIDTDTEGIDYVGFDLVGLPPLEEGEVYDISDEYALTDGYEDAYVSYPVQSDLELGEDELLAVDMQFDAEQLEAELLMETETQIAAEQDDIFSSDLDLDLDICQFDDLSI